MSISNLEVAVAERVSHTRELFNNSEAFQIPQIVSAVEHSVRALKNGNKLAFVGNGGSASEAIHLAAEFTGKCLVDHEPLHAVCLNESQSSLTAIANDYGFDQVFARQVAAQLKEGDILYALSTSGQSKNIIRALDVAAERGVRTYLWMGNFESQVKNVEIWKAPSKTT